MVSASVSALVALSLPRRAVGVTSVAFCSCHSLQRLMNWLWGCCQCVCALGEGVPVTGGNPSYGIRPGATIVAVLQGALGAGGPGSSSDPHTAVTPLETQRHSSLHGPLIGSDKMILCEVQQFHRETTWLCQTSLDGSIWERPKEKDDKDPCSSHLFDLLFPCPCPPVHLH